MALFAVVLEECGELGEELVLLASALWYWRRRKYLVVSQMFPGHSRFPIAMISSPYVGSCVGREWVVVN